MHRRIASIVLAGAVGIGGLIAVASPAGAVEPRCYGDVAAFYAQTGQQGPHSSSFAGERRLGIRNLARALYADGDGVLAGDTMADLAAWLDDQIASDQPSCDP